MSKNTLYLIVVSLLAFRLLAVQNTEAQTPFIDLEDLQQITATNLENITELGSVGQGGIGDLQWSPDGQTLLVSNNYGVWLHDAEQVDAAPRFIDEPKPEVLRFYPDSSHLITWQINDSGNYVESSDPYRAWDVEMGEQIEDHLLEEGNDYWRYWVAQIDMGPISRAEDRISFWDIQTGKLIKHHAFGRGIDLSYSRDNSLLLAERSNSEVVIFDTASGEVVRELSIGSQPLLYSSILSPDGNLVLVQEQDRTITLYSPFDNQPPRSLYTGDLIYSPILFTPDGRHIIAHHKSHGSDETIRLWDVQSGELLYTLNFEEDNRHNFGLYTSNEFFNRISLGTGEILLYDLQTGLQKSAITTNQELLSYRFTSQADRLAAFNSDGRLSIWDTTTGTEIGSTDRYYPVGGVKAVSPDNQFLLTETSETLNLWDIPTGNIIETFPYTFDYNDPPFTTAEFSPNGAYFAVNGTGVYDVISHELVYRLPEPAWDIAFSPDSSLVAAAYGHQFPSGTETATAVPIIKSIQLIDINAQKVVIEIPEPYGYGGGFIAVAFSPNSELLAGYRDDISIWNISSLETGDQEPLLLLPTEKSVSDLAFSADSSWLAASYEVRHFGGDGYSFYIPPPASAWNLERIIALTSDEADIEADLNFWGHLSIKLPTCYDTCESVNYSVTDADSIDYSYDDSFVAVDAGGLAILFDPETGLGFGYLANQYSLSLSPDSRLIISNGDDGRLHFWGVPKG